MDLRRLEYFLAVVEHGRVTSAAAALHVAQPSLSQAIRALERDLGVELFSRDGRGLTLTAAGQALIEPARLALGDLAVARAAVDSVVELTAGWLDIAVHDLISFDPLAGVLAAFHRRHAGVPVRLLDPPDEDEMIRLLIDGKAELAVTFLPLDHPGLRVIPVGAHEIWAVLPPGTLLRPGPLPVAQLAGRPLVDPIRGYEAARSIIRAALVSAGVALHATVRSRHREAIIPLVLAGVGLALTTPGHAREAARAGAVCAPLTPPIHCPYGVVYRDGSVSPAARAFISVLLQEMDVAESERVLP